MSCSKCSCTVYRWNPVSAVQKLVSGFKVSGSTSAGVAKADSNWSTLDKQDNTSKQTAYRACMCGHHSNYHNSSTKSDIESENKENK